MHEFERQLIFRLLASEPFEDLSLQDREIDWEYVFRQAEEHRLVPLIFQRLRDACSENVPAEVLEKFQNRYKEIAKFNFARTTQLIKLVGHLEKQGLPVIAYKGMILAEFAYGDTTLRQFTDIDLFVRKEDFPEVKKLLAGIGCRPVWELTESQEKATRKYDYEYPFYFGESDTLIEVHWEFVESFFSFDFEKEAIWERTVPVKLLGREIPTLSAEDYLIVLCAHGSKHFWKRLSWLCDVARLVENREELDWEVMIRRASRYGSLRMVWLGLYLAEKLFGTKLPEDISEKIDADRAIEPLGESFIEKMFEDEKEPSEWREMARIHLHMREKLSTKLKYSYRLFTTKLIDSLFLPMGRPR